MKQQSITLLILAMSFLMLSCNNDDPPTSARPPVYKELTLSKYYVEPEEEITATVEYEYSGKEIYKCEYRLSFIQSGNTSNTVNYDWIEVDPTKKKPTHTFKAPKIPGTYKATFKALHVNYSTGGPDGTPYGSSNSVSTNLVVVDPAEEE